MRSINKQTTTPPKAPKSPKSPKAPKAAKSARIIAIISPGLANQIITVILYSHSTSLIHQSHPAGHPPHILG